MALFARSRAEDLRVPGRGTLMARCLAAGLPVASSCGGRGACGKCAVEVLEGMDHLSPTSAREAETLHRNELPEPVRLACQCKVLTPRKRVLIQAGYW